MTNPQDVMFQVKYGSHLYGTATPTSDTDLKSVYLPPIDDLLLGKKLVAFKTREDANGNKVGCNESMPDNGVENEFISFQTFVRDFVQGQTYALEMLFAILNQGPSATDPVSVFEFEMIKELQEKFGNSEVYSMVGFAQKQTFDYVKRGERLAEAEKIRGVLLDLLSDKKLQAESLAAKMESRLDSKFGDADVIDVVSARAQLPIGSVVNNNRSLRTIELNGRSYPETTAISHLIEQLNKLIASYGHRAVAASLTKVEYKSLSHAVRVYQQSIELLDTGKISFPRPNPEELLRIKKGEADLEEIKSLLKKLDVEILQKIETSTMRKRTPELVAAAEVWLLEKLRILYMLN